MVEQGFPRLTDEGIRYRVLVHPSRDLTDPPQIGQQVLSLWGHTVLDSSQSRRFWVRWRPEQPMESWPVYTGVKAVERDALATDKIAKGYAPARAGPNKELIVTDGDIVEAWDFLTGSASLAPTAMSGARMLLQSIIDLCDQKGVRHDYLERVRSRLDGNFASTAAAIQLTGPWAW